MCSKSHTAEALRAVFEKYGDLEDVWVVRDKYTKESRGVAYIKFSKMSEATLAVEELDGKALDDDTKPIKVFAFWPCFLVVMAKLFPISSSGLAPCYNVCT